ncbi:MAG: helix-turn-helix transcriptional regulator [Prevotella sp.]|nr:helix-turn-helix transcriptional regulator [Prevotella sp.]
MPVYYYITLITCGVASVLLALVLSGVTIRRDESLKKYCTARWCLCVAFLVFGIANLFQAGIESDGREEALTGVMVIVIGSINAMMFTMVAHVFIRPSVVTRRNVILQAAVILLLSAFLFVARFTMPLRAFYVIYGVFLLGYLLLLAGYTYFFVKNYLVFKKQMLEYYEEEELLYRMRWLKWTFWSALAVGVSALLLTIDTPVVNMLFTCLFTGYYLLMTISFINYQQYAQLVVKAYEKPLEETDSVRGGVTQSADIELLTQNINQWVGEKRFAETDKSVDEIAQLLGTDSNTLRAYFTNHIGEDFRSWRNRIRIEEAKRLIDSNPTIKIIEVMTLTGFNDRPYFYRIFQKLVGVSVSEYREMGKMRN